MIDIETVIKRRDELQALYRSVHDHARELAGAVAALDELIELHRAGMGAEKRDGELGSFPLAQGGAGESVHAPNGE